MSASQSSSRSSSSSTTVTDSYNKTLNSAYNLNDVGNSTFSLHVGNSGLQLPEIADALPIAIGLGLLGLLLFFRK